MAFTYDSVPPAASARAEQRSTDPDDSAASFSLAQVWALAARWRGPSARKELPDFTRQLATLLQAGTNAPEALECLRRGVNSAELRGAVEALEIDTKRGLPLAAAMRRHPRIFERVYTEIVAAGERAGTLERMLDPLAAGLVTAERIRAKASRALIQPMFSLLAALGGGWYMTEKVVPTFADVYQRQGVELPVITRALIAIAHATDSVGTFGFGAAGIVLLLLPRVIDTAPVRRMRDRIVLRLPIFGPLERMSSVSSFMRFFAMLLTTEAIQEAEAIELAAQTAPNSEIAGKLAGAARDVAAGTAKVSGALERTGVIPPIFTQILHTGERTGQVAAQARYAADRLEEKVMDQVEKAQAAVAPLATCLVALVVGVMMLGLYGPMIGLYKVLLK